MKSTLQKIVLIMACSAFLVAFNNAAWTQCIAGETELVITISTDQWGYECYWQITPAGNNCDDGTLAEGGNLAQVGCNGGGGQDATTAQGYPDFASIEADPFCLTIGETYTLHYVDDYGDGGADFVLNLFGFPIYNFDGTGDGGAFDFVVQEPQAYDVMGQQVLSYSYVQQTNNVVRGKFFSYGSETITDLEFSYSVNGESAITGTVSGLNIAPFTAFELDHPVIWNEDADGEYELTIWISEINGNTDMNNSNDEAVGNIIVGPGIPNILDSYIGYIPETEEIAGSGQSIVNPRDLDFHPILNRNELWVVLKSTESSGGKTVQISNAGELGQDELLQQDGNAWHFMSLPTGIAFSRNENFATSPGVYDANHDGGQPFTGPALWSSHPDIYAQPSGGNGSHLDMLHESPYTMGITWETGNKFWVTCGDHDEVMSFDFREDHGPGNDDHADGIIYKYPIPDYSEDDTHEVPDHLILDHATGWLYVCQSELNRVFRINTATGTPGDDETFHEAVDVYKYMEDFVWEDYITTGLDRPTGIDIVEDRMIVSNYSTGDINLYDISGPTPVLLEIIPTGSNGIMGIKVGPDGLIWYVNSVTDKVMRITQQSVSIQEMPEEVHFNVTPNPANSFFSVSYSNTFHFDKLDIQVLDISGRIVKSETMGLSNSMRIETTELPSGVYFLRVRDKEQTLQTKQLIIQR
jgi:hypothetical protein